MADHSAGSAKLEIFPDATGFQKRLKADLEKINVDFKVQVHPNLAQATVDLDRWRQQQQRKDIELKVNVDTSAASAKIGALERTLKGVNGGGNGFGGNGSGGGILGALKLNAGVLGVGSLPALATGITAVASSIQQLAGAGAALPGALGGLAVTIGTVKVGMSGVADAFKAADKASDGTAKSIKAMDKALAGLAPSAAEAVKAGIEIKKQLTDALVKPTQQNLFDGLAESARKLVNSDLPVVQRGMAATATAINGNLKQLFTSLGSDSSQSFLDKIFGNTADAETRAQKAIDPIVHAFGGLAATSSNVLPRLADGLTKVGTRFDAFVTKNATNGNLDKWINDGIDGLDHLGNTALNIGKSFTAITQAAGTGGLLTTLDSLTGKLSTFLNSDTGQADLANFFQEGKDQLAKWEPIIANVAQTLPSLYEGAKQWTDALLPALTQITGFLASSPDLVKQVAVAFVAWKTIDGVASLLTSLAKVSSILSVGIPAAAAEGAAGAGTALAGIAIPAGLAAVLPFAGVAVGFATVGSDILKDAPPSPENARSRGNLATANRIANGAPPITPKPHPAPGPDPTAGLQSLPGFDFAPNAVPSPPTGASTDDLPRTIAPRAPNPAVDQILAAATGAPTVVAPSLPAPSTTISPKVDPAAQASVDNLAKSIQTLPTGEVKITDGTPPVLDAVKKLDVQVTSLKDHPGEVIVHANTEEAQTKLDALIRNFQSRIITIQVQPQMGALPVAPGKATGGINGILPGYSPGVDNMLVPMSGGEGVIIPQITRQLGPQGIAAINRGDLTMSKRGHKDGDIVDPHGNPITVGSAPGPGGFIPGAGPSPIAANGVDSGGVGGIFSSVLSGLGGPINNIAGLAGGLGGGGQAGTGFTSTGSFMDRLAGVPGIAGLIGSAGSSNPGAALDQWGGSTGKWLGGFAAKTIGGFGSALWQGALGLVGLDNSILSPTNPYFQDIAKAGGAELGPDSLLGNLLGTSSSGAKGATDKQIREGGQKVTRADQKVAGIVQKIKELKPTASQSQRGSLRDQLLNAQQDAADARTDFSTLTGGADPASAQLAAQASLTDPTGTSHHGGPGTLTPMSGGEGIIDPATAAQLGPDGIAALNAGKMPIAKKGFAAGGINIPAGVVLPPPNLQAAKAATAQIKATPKIQAPTASTRQAPGPTSAAPAVPAPGTPPPPVSAKPADKPLDGSPTPVVGAAPTDYNHNLAAINTGIASGASAIGSAVSMALGIAGSSGFAPGAGAIGQIAAGAIQEGGKIVTDLVNVGSSFLVGSVPGNLGGDGPAQGSTLTAPQNVPQTAQDNSRNYNITAGYQPSDLINALQLHDAQQSQAANAQYRG